MLMLPMCRTAMMPLQSLKDVAMSTVPPVTRIASASMMWASKLPVTIGGHVWYYCLTTSHGVGFTFMFGGSPGPCACFRSLYWQTGLLACSF